jgi:hypothetical protein
MVFLGPYLTLFVKGDQMIFNIVNINFNNEIKVMKESYIFEDDDGAFME